MLENIKLEMINSSEHLCFNPAVFLNDSFSIDDFLRSHRNKATLEVLRNDLGSYLKELRLSMIELINKDYEDFVNLSKDLVGLNAGIEVLQNPLEDVKAEVNLVRHSLMDAIKGMTNCIQLTAEVKRKKQSLFHLSQVIISLQKLRAILIDKKICSTISLDFIERISSEYTILQFSVAKCSNIMSVTQKNDYEAVGKTLKDLLRNTFLAGISEQDSSHLHRCLRMFASLNKIQEAEKCVQEEVVVPFLYDLINETSLKNEGLNGVYQKVIEFINSRLQVLLLLSDQHGFDFLINSLWLELSKRLELHTNSIFSAGDPEVFHKRYTETTKFLKTLQMHCRSPAAVARFISHPLTIHFLEKWNLLVYYKIRFQEIAGQFELALSEGLQSSWNGSEYHLKIPAVANLCLHRCWDENVFIPELNHLFWRLSLQIIARYCTWVKETACQVVEPTSDVGDLAASSDNLHVQKLISLHSDSLRLASESRTLLLTALEQYCTPDTRPSMSSCMNDSSQLVTSALSAISSVVVETLVRKSALPLSNVRDIPRLFRRTNRDTPTRPCEYVNQILDSIISFKSDNTSKVDDDVLEAWISSVLNQVTSLYYASVSEVLENAQKTEESLRRLKKAKDKFVGNSMGKGPTDDDKIRQQLVVDVHFYAQQVDSLNLGAERIAVLEKLIQLVEKAKEKSEKL